MSNITIVISPSQQTGIEENLVRPIAEKLFQKLQADKLTNCFITPDYTGMSDEAALWNVIQFSNNIINANGGSGYHLDIHADAGAYATGCSGLYVSENGRNFITPITQAIMNITPWNDVGIRKRTDLGVLNNTIAVAGLIELSFYDNKTEYQWMLDNSELITDTLKAGIYKALNIQPTVDWETKYNNLLDQYYRFKREILDVTNKYI